MYQWTIYIKFTKNFTKGNKQFLKKWSIYVVNFFILNMLPKHLLVLKSSNLSPKNHHFFWINLTTIFLVSLLFFDKIFDLNKLSYLSYLIKIWSQSSISSQNQNSKIRKWMVYTTLFTFSIFQHKSCYWGQQLIVVFKRFPPILITFKWEWVGLYTSLEAFSLHVFPMI